MRPSRARARPASVQVDPTLPANPNPSRARAASPLLPATRAASPLLPANPNPSRARATFPLLPANPNTSRARATMSIAELIPSTSAASFPAQNPNDAASPVPPGPLHNVSDMVLFLLFFL